MKNEENIKSEKKERFNQEKECRLLMMSHRFISTSDPFWELFREKLVHMRDLYGGRHAIQLCPVCLTIYVSGNPKKHPKTSIGSLFFQFDPSKKTAKEVAELFKDQGRVKNTKSGGVLVGIPSFGQICVENHRSLEGSRIQFKAGCNNQKNEENQAEATDTSTLKKRAPQRQTGTRIEKKSLNYEQKNSIWRPVSKGSIPPLATSKSAYLNSSLFKQTKPSKREE